MVRIKGTIVRIHPCGLLNEDGQPCKKPAAVVFVVHHCDERTFESAFACEEHAPIVEADDALSFLSFGDPDRSPH